MLAAFLILSFALGSRDHRCDVLGTPNCRTSDPDGEGPAQLMPDRLMPRTAGIRHQALLLLQRRRQSVGAGRPLHSLGIRVHRAFDDDLRRRGADALDQRAEPLVRRLPGSPLTVATLKRLLRRQRERAGHRACRPRTSRSRVPCRRTATCWRRARTSRCCAPPTSPSAIAHRVPVVTSPGLLCASCHWSDVGPGHHIARSTMIGTPLVDVSASTPPCRQVADPRGPPRC